MNPLKFKFSLNTARIPTVQKLYHAFAYHVLLYQFTFIDDAPAGGLHS